MCYNHQSSHANERQQVRRGLKTNQLYEIACWTTRHRFIARLCLLTDHAGTRLICYNQATHTTLDQSHQPATQTELRAVWPPVHHDYHIIWVTCTLVAICQPEFITRIYDTIRYFCTARAAWCDGGLALTNDLLTDTVRCLQHHYSLPESEINLQRSQINYHNYVDRLKLTSWLSHSLLTKTKLTKASL